MSAVINQARIFFVAYYLFFFYVKSMKISVIVPVYNVLPLVSGCLDSLRTQTWKDFECVCVDDGSTDGSGAFLDNYVKQDKRFSVIHQKNGGLSAARNTGLKHIKGDYVFFLDGDDYLHPQTLEMLSAFITQQAADVMVFSLVNTGKAYADTTFPKLNAQDYAPKEIKDPLATFMKKRTIRTGAPLKLYKKSAIKGLNFYTMHYEDVVFAFQLFARSPRVFMTKAPLYYYYANPESIMRSSFDEKKLNSYLKLFEIINEERLKLQMPWRKQAQVYVINKRLKMCFNRIAKKQKDPKVQEQLLKKLQQVLPDLKARGVISYQGLGVKHICLLWMLLHRVKMSATIRFLHFMY